MSHHDFLHDIASTLTLSLQELVYLIAKAPHSYKVYRIEKKTGGKRIIAQPARQIKYLQRALIHSVFKELPIHSCATAYAHGSSIKKNAEPHKNNKFISKFDISDFFGSIKEHDLIKHFNRHLAENINPDYFRYIARSCCINYKGTQELVLSVGAPSSPILSNSIMHEFDCIIHDWCTSKNITYTRYADDLTFSSNTKGVSFEIEKAITEALNSLDYPTLKLNTKKTFHASKKSQRRITGLIISNEGKISLGRDRKRTISAMIHKFSNGALPEEDIPKLQGMLGFAEDVEPVFSSRMRAKYGVKAISEIFQYRKQKK
ncbi:retron St85 family RNA-directed DNA polymerase [Pseudomonas sp. TCU-HL1]|uniref:retron St85 family RNA-directed DNA polymerase n=1 Tax=Pseudomonas sp. TCU-HL1 TaxID=1856685 RepID=UPI00083D589A|nr:retron St85 family RNA-directed DNA polymerase [Pseudomonas sp. TCU-HL1]AOE84641.1 hypothetical protein THL1_2093 [Pseudomonas sp. TCU-HL1]